MNKVFLIVVALIFSNVVSAQQTFPVNGTHNNKHTTYFLTEGTIHVDYETTLNNADMIVRDGVVVEVGNDLSKPKGAVVVNLKDKHVYPSFIDPFSSYGMPKPEKKKRDYKPHFDRTKNSPFGWNDAIRPEVDAVEVFAPDKKAAKDLRNNGFGTVVTHQADGIVRGTSVGVLLNHEAKVNEQILNGFSSAQYSFKKGTSIQNYPSSLMGSIALLRQTYYDAEWYAKSTVSEEFNLSLQSFLENQSLTQVFDVTDYQSAIRADKIGDEFGVQYLIVGSGDEYKDIEYIKATNAAFIIPVNFPDAYDVEDPYDAMVVSLQDMKHWELAPHNARILAENDVPFAFTSKGLKSPNDYLKNVKKAVESGLSSALALKAMTYNPAQLISEENSIGTLNKGKLANFIITSDSLFAADVKINENWIKGIKYTVNSSAEMNLSGNYNFKIGNQEVAVEITKKSGKHTAKIVEGEKKRKATIGLEKELVSISFNLDTADALSRVSLSGYVSNVGSISGRGQLASGEWVNWMASKTGNLEKEKAKEEEKTLEEKESVVPGVWYPNRAYGYVSKPKTESVAITNVTAWTCEEEGIVEEATVILENGKIKQVGKDIAIPEGMKTIDGTGKHLSPGIIDEHSHIAISRGVNECTHAITSEVRIGDVINSNDINIYRQLSGGVTASQLLHGSCNPVGGQSALIKLRWGVNPEQMKIEGAEGFIKFALGENVKRSNFGPFNTVRFPQTRMGVEQVYYDAFTRAREYENGWEGFFTDFAKLKKKDQSSAKPPRKDLQLDALLQILNSDRFISCHSYQQSEINMLMHVADSMGFTVNTFTHILEGYKVADKMREHGAGGSTFSDWWAYKYEVNDAIPYNGAIMHEQGVVTAFNSDDAEMGRRLNQEAGKAVKYGGVSQEEALKFVTLNPAKLLHLDDKMGSLKAGKDADVVLWTDNPLSIYAKVEKTFVDGICYYDSAKNDEMNARNDAERARLINKMIASKKGGSPTQKPVKKEPKLYHCDTVEETY